MGSSKGSFLFLLMALVGVIFNSPLSQRLLATTLDPTHIKTNPTRLSAVSTFCSSQAGGAIVSDSEKSTNKQYFSIMKVYFNVDITSIFKSVLSMDLSAMMSGVQSILTPLIIYVLPFVIGLVLGLALWTCLCCCCTCPGCCPSKCCRKDDDILYTKCELIWPAVFLLLILALAIAASIPGITQSGKLVESVKTMECGLAVALDNIANGNITSDNTSFFFGTNTLMTIFASFKAQLGTISTNINSVTSAIGDVITRTGTIKSDLENLAGSPNATYAITYTDPTPSAGTVNSLFNSVFGSPSNTSSISGIEYEVMRELGSSMTTIQGQISTLSGSIGSGDLANYIDAAVNQFSPINNQLNDYTNMITGMFDGFINTYLDYVKLGILVFFAVAIGLSAIALIGVILTAFFDKAKCRYLMYVACVFMVIIVILGFLIAFIFSFITPVLYLACGFLNTSIDTNTGFNNFINDMNIGGIEMVKSLSVCFPGGDGDILKALGISQLDALNDQIGNMTGAMAGFYEYANIDTTVATTQVDNMVKDQITSWLQGTKNDLVDSGNTAAIAYLTQVSQSDPSLCNHANFALDSLVTSTNVNSTNVIPCQKSNIITCGASDNFATIAWGGCIDMTSCFANYPSGAGGQTSVITDITARYPTCATFAGNIGDLFLNWDNKRRDTGTGIGKIQADYNANISPDMVSLKTEMDTVKTNFDSAFDNLNNTIEEVVNPDYGLMAGLKCRVLGDDIITAKNTVCVSLFNSIFFLLVTMGTTSFALLFGLCCIVCTGVRHYKQDLIKARVLAVNTDPYEQTFVHLNDKKNYP